MNLRTLLILTTMCSSATLGCVSGGFEDPDNPDITEDAATSDDVVGDWVDSGADAASVETTTAPDVTQPSDVLSADTVTYPEWTTFTCGEELTGTGVKEGDIAHDFVQTDQTGAQLHLHNFCDHVVLLVGSAFW